MSSRWRLLSLNLFFVFAGILLLSRLFYYAVLNSDKLTALAESQQHTTLEVAARRGEILTSDDSFLVANQPAFFTYYKKDKSEPIPFDLIDNLAPIVYSSISFSATPSSQLSETDKKILIDKTKDILIKRINDERLLWVPIAQKIHKDQKLALEDLNIKNLMFEQDQTRLYPEASMSAQLLGFVGFNDQGKDQGFYGLEGFYQRELAGRPGIIRQE